MAYTDKDKNPVVSVDNFHWIDLTTNTSSSYTHDTMKGVEGLINVSWTFETSTGTLYGDGKPLINTSNVIGVDLTVDIFSFKEEDRATIFGNTYDPVTGLGSIKPGDTAPQIAIAFRAVLESGDFKYYKFPVATAQLQDITQSTRTADIEYQTFPVLFKCIANSKDDILVDYALNDAEIATFFDAAV